MAMCRLCGASCSDAELKGVERGGGCINCGGSPPCTRCGHPRRRHTGTFGSGRSACRVDVALDDGSLAIGRCGCPGYSSEPQAVDDVGVTDVRVLRLRPPAA